MGRVTASVWCTAFSISLEQSRTWRLSSLFVQFMRATNACSQHEIIFAVASNENMYSLKPEIQLGAYHCTERPIQTHSNPAPKGSLEIYQEQTAWLALLWLSLGWFSWNSAEKCRCMQQRCWIFDTWHWLGTDADRQVLAVRAGEEFERVPGLILF